MLICGLPPQAERNFAAFGPVQRSHQTSSRFATAQLRQHQKACLLSLIILQSADVKRQDPYRYRGKAGGLVKI